MALENRKNVVVLRDKDVNHGWGVDDDSKTVCFVPEEGGIRVAAASLGRRARKAFVDAATGVVNLTKVDHLDI